ncbi:MAG: hypothetical protein IAE95_13695 [Chitinophagaceae bacterium]|nr:hypothetical protein [Chitinophagaceae bacterium]
MRVLWFVLLSLFFVPLSLAPASAAIVIHAQAPGQPAPSGSVHESPLPLLPSSQFATPGKRSGRESGWRGTVSLLLGVIAIIFYPGVGLFVLPAALAIAFGIPGLRSFRRNKLFAVIGILLGLYVLSGWVIALISLL